MKRTGKKEKKRKGNERNNGNGKKKIYQPRYNLYVLRIFQTLS